MQCNYSAIPQADVGADGNLLSSEARCDGLDNNCNGTADDGFGLGAACDSTADNDSIQTDVVTCGATPTALPVCTDLP